MFRPSALIARFTAILVLAVTFGAAVPLPLAAADDNRSVSIGTPSGARFLALGIGKSTVIDLPRDAKDVLVANPAIANAVVRSARRAYLIGVAPGQTNVIFFDAEGRQMVAYDIEVGRDASGVREALRRMMPRSSIKVDAVNDSVVLTGEVANATEAQHAVDAATRLVGDPAKVVNGLTIRGGEQVLVKVTVAEIQRTALKQLGIDINGVNISIGNVSLDLDLNNSPTDVTNIVTPTYNFPNGGSISVALRAMEQAGVLRTLAEPNLTAISGEAAEFLAGGEFPIPLPGSLGSPPTIEFKKFGVALNFTPVVLSEGRISMKVATEVSELSNDGAVIISGISIPALKVRRANSTVELPSGGSLALAGLLQSQTRQNLSGMPGLMNIPILGTLFRSREYQTGQTELVILVTPYVVRPVARQALARPDDGFAEPADPASVLLGQLNRIYGGPGTVSPKRSYHGNYGFILD
jgi:pilus assembly protein CpaC